MAGDLRRLFNTLKLAPAIALRITELKSNEELDGPHESGILDFAYEYGSTTEAKPFDDNVCFIAGSKDSDFHRTKNRRPRSMSSTLSGQWYLLLQL